MLSQDEDDEGPNPSARCNEGESGSISVLPLNSGTDVPQCTAPAALAKYLPNKSRKEPAWPDIFEKARSYWRDEFCRHSSIVTKMNNKQRLLTLNKLFNKLSRAERNEWCLYAEALRKHVYEGGSSNPKPIKPQFLLKTEPDYMKLLDVPPQSSASSSSSSQHQQEPVDVDIEKEKDTKHESAMDKFSAISDLKGSTGKSPETVTAPIPNISDFHPKRDTSLECIKVERIGRKYWKAELRVQPRYWELRKSIRKKARLAEIFKNLSPSVKKDWMDYGGAMERNLVDPRVPLPVKPIFDMHSVLQTQDQFSLSVRTTQSAAQDSNWRGMSPSADPSAEKTNNETGPRGSVLDPSLQSHSSSISWDSEKRNRTLRETLSPSPSADPTEKEPLMSKNGRLITITGLQNKARVHWRAEFRRHNSSSELRKLSKSERKSKLNQLFGELSEAEKQKWTDYAEARLKNLYQSTPPPLKPAFDFNSGAARLPSTSTSIQQSSTRRLAKRSSDESQDDLKPNQRNTKMDLGSDVSDSDCTVNDSVVNVVKPCEKRILANAKLIKKSKVQFRKYLRNMIKETGPCFPKLSPKQRKAKLNEMWEELDESEQMKWIRYTEKVQKNKRAKVPVSISPPSISAFLLSLSSVGQESSRRRNRKEVMLGQAKRDKASVVKDIPKPQEKFEFKVDNSVGPFVPILRWKPRSMEESRLAPYVPRKELEEDGTEAENYENPYEVEIKAWTPTESQLATDTVCVIPSVLVPEPFDLLDTLEGIEEMRDHLSTCAEIGVDLEHHSVRSYMGLTCLIQISTRTRDFILDGLALYRKLDWLNQVFTNPRIIKVFHGAESDIQWLQRDFGLYVVGMFDTCIAGERLYGKQLSLKHMLETHVDQVKEVDKTHQIADWRVRPLPIEMLHYARMDTHYLLPLYDILKKKLEDAGDEKLKQVFLDSSARCLTTYKKPDGQLSLKQKEFLSSLNSRQSQAFEELLKWRDSVGRSEDESPENYILSNVGLERLARTLPSDETHLTEILETNCNDVISPMVLKYMETVLRIMASAREIPLSPNEEEEMRDSVDSDSDEREVRCVGGGRGNKNLKKIPVIPSVEELFAEEDNFLEKNLTVGPYPSSHQYLSTHFNLLREDFIRSVKPGLKALKEGRHLGTRNGVRVHTNIQLMSMDKKKLRIGLPERLRKVVVHEETRRFLPGSLLLFTNNNYADVYLGLISHPRNKPGLEEEDKGIYSVGLRGNHPETNWEPGTSFVTIECDAFFEPYRCVMTTLKQNSWLNSIPITKYLLNPNFDGIIGPPKYLRRAKTFNVASVAVNSKDFSDWPSAHEIGFDDAQFKAYQAALTQEFVVIQGPPGTGKTYLGLRILETLMEEENIPLWRGKKGGPIIIVCYTNHALDQFGDGILDLFTPPDERDSEIPYEVTSPRILRLGSGCQSPRLKAYVPEPGKRSTVHRDKVDILLMTTTGAAIRHHKLMTLNSKIMIVEEAAEVFESHIIGSFTPSLEHLILLGDHQQLRPLTASRDLAVTYDLDVSLFERMVALNEFPRHQLQVQHRMRPSIRDLITGPHMYPILLDHETVTQYPANVLGMERPLFFIDHRVQEAQKLEDATSHSNHYEVEYLGFLCAYLLRAGHPPSSITVLGMYSSQVRLLEREIRYRRGVPASLRIETLDSFQGEENDIILLSLVRSNTSKEIGFMREDNRICVAMSRARQGFYMIGNMELLASVSRTWRTIHRKLAQNGNIGPVLNLCCDKHVPKKITQVRTISDFHNALHTPCAECKSSSRNSRKPLWK